MTSKDFQRKTFLFNLPIFFILIILLAFSALILTDNLQQAKVSPDNAEKTLADSNLPMPNITGEKAKEYLKDQGLYESLGEAMQAARYSINPTKNAPLPNETEALKANNPRQGFSTYFGKDGIHLISKAKNNEWRIKMNLKGLGYGDKITPVEQGEMQVQKNKSRIEIEKFAKEQSKTPNLKSKITEWYENGSDGLEQGWTIKEKLSVEDSEDLKLVLKLGGDLKAKISKDKQAIDFVKPNEEQILRYDKLKSWDADGKALASRMELNGKELSIVVDDKDAKYPITIDPFFTQTKKLIASDDAGGDNFGWSVAISGDTAVVGAIGDGSASGSAYIFERNSNGMGGTLANNWGEVKKLTASDPAGGDIFGRSVAISGDTAIVGAPSNDDVPNDSGSAYIFERNSDGMGGTSADNWGEVKKLTASDAAASDTFGYSVGISGDTAIIGAIGNDDVPNNSGSAYIFERNSNGMGGTLVNNWGEVKKLTASDADSGDQFGWSAAISGDTAIVGAIGNADAGINTGSAYIFERNSNGMGGTSADNWGEVKKLTASDAAASDNFGWSIGISGDTAIVGAFVSDAGGINSGSAYIFERNSNGMGGTLVNNWGEVKQLAPSDANGFDEFGHSVGISGDTAIVGARFNDDVPNNSGSAYIFERNTGGAENWGQVQKILASDAAGSDEFGFSVAISGDTAIVGAYLNDDGGSASGSAYIFTNQFNNWTQGASQTSGDGTAGDEFGFSVAISGDTAVVGARFDNNNTGAAYIFERNVGGANLWGQLKKIQASNNSPQDLFGHAVAISNDIVIVGAPTADPNNEGAAYIFERNFDPSNPGTPLANNWGERKILVGAEVAFNARLGLSVAVDGNTAVAGAWTDDVAGNNSQGAAYVYERNSNGAGGILADNWGQVKRLTGSSGATNDTFGQSVGISNDTIVVGGTQNFTTGKAYIFERNVGGAENWGEVKLITASDAAATDSFGFSAAISGDIVIIGSFRHTHGGTNSGAAYIFERNYDPSNPGTPLADNWGERKELLPSVPDSMDEFGISVAISGDKALVGAHNDNIGGNADQGAAYIFARNSNGSGGISADNWGFVTQLTDSSGAAGDGFGRGVGISNNKVIVGAFHKDISAFSENPDENEAKRNAKVRAPAIPNLAGADQGGMVIFNALAAPSAALAMVAGRVTTSTGRGIGRVSVRITDLEGNSRLATTNQFGYFQFTGIEVGETYLVSVSSKRYRFDQDSQAITVQNDLKDLRFIGFE